MNLKTLRSAGVLLALLALITAPAFARGGVVAHGIDTWWTPDDGSSFVDFADEPIPAGFFCAGSEPFTGRISWQGQPLATNPPGALGQTDTVVQRLDDAIFDKNGVATTRLQMRALSLASLEPVRTNCGRFDVTATLLGEQPVTTMGIVRERPGAGTFTAPLALRVKLTFTPVEVLSTARTVVLERNIQLNSPRISWTSEPPAETFTGQVGGYVVIDTDGDSLPDTTVPGQGGLFANQAVEPNPSRIQVCLGPVGAICHDIDGTCHCAYP